MERKEEELGPAEEEDRREKKVREEEESWRSGDRPPQDRGVTAGADTACYCGQLKMNLCRLDISTSTLFLSVSLFH